MSEDAVPITSVEDWKVALFADGQRISDWAAINPDGSTGLMTVHENRVAQVLKVGISTTPDGPLTYIEAWPNGPLRGGWSFSPPGETTYIHAVIGGEAKVVLHPDGTGEIHSTGLVIDLGEEGT